MAWNGGGTCDQRFCSVVAEAENKGNRGCRMQSERQTVCLFVGNVDGLDIDRLSGLGCLFSLGCSVLPRVF